MRNALLRGECNLAIICFRSAGGRRDEKSDTGVNSEIPADAILPKRAVFQGVTMGHNSSVDSRN